MIDALLYAVRDGIRAAGIGYDHASCEIMGDGKPPDRAGNYFVAIHGGRSRPGPANDSCLFEMFDFTVTLTARVTVPLDRAGDQQIARNLERIPQGIRQGFNARLEQLRAMLHMRWEFVVMTNQTPPSANDNLVAWSTGLVPEVYGFCEPMRYRGSDAPRLVGGEWFDSDPEVDDVGIVADMRFQDAKRFQPVRTITRHMV